MGQPSNKANDFEDQPRDASVADAGDEAEGAPSQRRSLVVHSSYDPEHRVVAVTGAHSFLGEELIRLLEADRRYVKVLAIDIRRPDIQLTKTQFHKVDLTLPNADGELARLLAGEKVDTLVHLAFLTKPSHNTTWAHELEAIGTLHVCNACAASKVRKLVMWSRTALYGADPRNPNFLDEDAPLRGVPGSRFFADKAEAERLVRRFRHENPGALVSVLRTAFILGRRFNNFVSRYLDMPVVPVMMGYDPVVQLLHEEDAVNVFKICVDDDHNGEFNIASDGVLPLSTVLAMAGKLSVPLPHFAARPLGKTLWMTQVVTAPPMFLDFLRYLCVADTRRMRVELGYTPRHTIREVVRQFAGLSGGADEATAHPEPRHGAYNA